jgi:hypothetical protein
VRDVGQTVAMDLKKRGVFLCRSLSFKQCTFEFIVQELDNTDFGKVFDEVKRVRAIGNS